MRIGHTKGTLYFKEFLYKSWIVSDCQQIPDTDATRPEFRASARREERTL